MITRLIFALCVTVLAAFAAVPPQINYQGQLTSNSGTPLDTTVAMTFKLYDGSGGGATLLWTEAQPAVTVADGLFAVNLGSITALTDAILNQSQVWLGITVGGDTEMTPRTPIVSVAYSYRTGTVDGASGGIVQGDISVGRNHTRTGLWSFANGDSNTVLGGYSSVGGRRNRVNDDGSFIGGGQDNITDGTSNTILIGEGNRTTGNFSTIIGGRNNRVNGGSAFIGGGTGNITDGTSNTILFGDSNRTAGQNTAIVGGRGNRANFDNSFIGGGIGNITDGTSNTIVAGESNRTAGTCATIAGGQRNYASGPNSFVGGGIFNKARGWSSVVMGGGTGLESDSNSAADRSVVGGGFGNNILTSDAVIGGGFRNTIPASAWGATIAGGGDNRASGYLATVGGGTSNTASGVMATVPGGFANAAAGARSFAAGSWASANHNGCFVWADSSGGYVLSTTAADQYLIRAAGGVGIGLNNPAEALDVNGIIKTHGGIRFPDGTLQATAGISSGQQYPDTNSWDATRTWVRSMGYLRGNDNVISANGYVGGGDFNKARGAYAVVSGGGSGLEADSNSATGNSSFIGGGRRNLASSTAATIAGGEGNVSSSSRSTVGGGFGNTSSSTQSTVSGGELNEASGSHAFVGGGGFNYARGAFAAIAGGGGDLDADSNSALGIASVIPGGRQNETSGSFSLAAGFRAKANHSGAFVWADSTNSDFASTAVDQFNVRSSGGINMWTNSAATVGVTLLAGDNTWNSICDSTLKTRLGFVNTKEMLDKVSQLPVSRWHHKDGDPNLQHIGPMAQDFWNAFHVGGDSLKISTLDPSGIALAAIQELAKENAELRARLGKLETQIQSQIAGERQSLKEEK